MEQKCNKQIDKSSKNPGNNGDMEIRVSYSMLGGCFSLFFFFFKILQGFPGGSVRKESACNTGDLSSIPKLGRSPLEGNSNPYQYSCLGDPTDRGAWWATVHGVAKSRT